MGVDAFKEAMCYYIMINKEDVLSDYNLFQKLMVSVVIDHGRAGNMFFMRLFDQHPEILVVARTGYFYSNLIDIFDGENEIFGDDALKWLVNKSKFRGFCLDMSPEIEADCRHIGEDPFIDIDRGKVLFVLKTLLKGRVTKRTILLATHLAYCYGTGRDFSKFQYILINDSITGDNERKIFFELQNDFGKIKIIHLIRDPRANFASLRHQFVNAFSTMYPLFPKRIFKSLPSNAIWLWVLFYTTAGALDMNKFTRKVNENDLYRIRIEDVNVSFVDSMKKLTDWLGICWDDIWSDPKYSVTSVGKPWRGISAYKSYYQENQKGPIKNDVIIKNIFAKPDSTLPNKWKKHVTKGEERFLESIYYDEIKECGYKIKFINSKRDIIKGVFFGLLPFSGEIPSFKWYFTVRNEKKIKDIIIKITYLPLLPIFYFTSRAHLLFLFFSGRLRTRP